jgi:hypothetical protein
MRGGPFRANASPRLNAAAGAIAGPIIGALLVCGCSGDFDRPRPLLFGEGSTLELPEVWVEPTRSQFAFTQAEQRMRRLAYPLLLPPDGGGWWEIVPVDLSYVAVIADQGPPYDRQAFGALLMTMPARSEVERYARLLDIIADDMLRIDHFNAAARQVLTDDSERVHSLSRAVGLTEGERNNARARMAENSRIIKRVGICLKARAAAYRYAAQRLAIAVPSRLQLEVDRKLATYERRIYPFDVGDEDAAARGVYTRGVYK